jgi:hypothetical protein
MPSDNLERPFAVVAVHRHGSLSALGLGRETTELAAAEPRIKCEVELGLRTLGGSTPLLNRTFAAYP